jgi:hypothetical protein
VSGRRRVLLGLHPHELFVAPPDTAFERLLHVTVGQVEDLGSTRHIRFGLGAHSGSGFGITDRGGRPVEEGDRIELSWRGGKVRLFDAQTGVALATIGD